MLKVLKYGHWQVEFGSNRNSRFTKNRKICIFTTIKSDFERLFGSNADIKMSQCQTIFLFVSPSA